MARTKDDGGTNGFFDYCDGATLCTQGEGDCDNDGQCDAGLVCVDNIGDNFGMYWSTDVCTPSHCENGVQDGDETAIDFGGSCGGICGGADGDPGHCRPGCECAAGFGDCDNDNGCQAGLVCNPSSGAAFGYHWSVGVCVPSHCDNGVQDADETAIDFGGADCGGTCTGQNGDLEGYCTPGCPCGDGEGDCDSDDECQAGLTCRSNLGPSFGLLPTDDVCADPFTMAEIGAGDLVITEIMINPLAIGDGFGEWFEVYNASRNAIDLQGMHVRDASQATAFDVAGSHVVQPREHFTFVRTQSAGFVGGYDYPNTFLLADTTDRIVLETALNGTVIDQVLWNSTWPLVEGSSVALGRNHYADDNNNRLFWCHPTVTYGSGDFGSPGALNRICP